MISPFSNRSKEHLARIVHDRRGNVLMIMGFSVIPLTLATGMAIDYSQAARLQTKMNAAADAAALAAVTQPMMKENDGIAKDAAIKMFNAQVSELQGLEYNPANLKIEFLPGTLNVRTVTVSYAAKSTNSFAGVIGMRVIDIGGTSTATATAAPNIDFYLALDTSPSMALPTTSEGFTIMHNAVGCAFACHSNKIEGQVPNSMKSMIFDNAKFALNKGSYPRNGTGADEKQPIDAKGTYFYVNRTTSNSKCRVSSTDTKDLCIYNADGTFVDSYWYALNKGVRLRVTEEKIAAKDLMTLAKANALANNRAYRAALYTFDHLSNFKTISKLTSNLDALGSAASAIDLVTVNDRAGNGRPPNGESGTEYLFTSFRSVLTNMLAELPAVSGKGSNQPNDTPQALLFMVTDGMSDENIGSGRTRKEMQQQQIDQCTAIKKRGIKIAILYTEYTVESIKDDEPNQRAIATAAIPKIAPALTKCASPDLMYTVKTDQSITEALQGLFTKAVATARLSK